MLLPKVDVTSETSVGYYVKSSFDIWSEPEFLDDFGIEMKACGFATNTTVVNQDGIKEAVLAARSSKRRRLVSIGWVESKLATGLMNPYVRAGQPAAAFDRTCQEEIENKVFWGKTKTKLHFTEDIEDKASQVAADLKGKEAGEGGDDTSDEPSSSEHDDVVDGRRGRVSGFQNKKKKGKSKAKGKSGQKGLGPKRKGSAPVSAPGAASSAISSAGSTKGVAPAAAAALSEKFSGAVSYSGVTGISSFKQKNRNAVNVLLYFGVIRLTLL